MRENFEYITGQELLQFKRFTNECWMKDIGVYCIYNKITHKRYFGTACGEQKTHYFYKRWREHVILLNKQQHCNQHLQSSWNKYGAENFVFYVVEYLSDLASCLEKEQFCMNKFKSYNPNYGYNKASQATGGSGDLSTFDFKNGKACITYEQLEQIVLLLQDEYLNLNNVAKVVGVKKWVVKEISSKKVFCKAVEEILQELNLKEIPKRKSQKDYFEEHKEEIFQKVELGWSASKIAEFLGVNKTWLCESLKEYNKNKPRKTAVYIFNLSGNFLQKCETIVLATQWLKNHGVENIKDNNTFSIASRKCVVSKYILSLDQILRLMNRLEILAGQYLRPNGQRTSIVKYTEERIPEMVFERLKTASNYLNVSMYKMQENLKNQKYYKRLNSLSDEEFYLVVEKQPVLVYD